MSVWRFSYPDLSYPRIALKQAIASRYNAPMQPEHWLATPLGRRCLNNEQRLVRRMLDCVFGEQLLQIGTWGAPDQFIRYART
jgi:hypothetical protein